MSASGYETSGSPVDVSDMIATASGMHLRSRDRYTPQVDTGDFVIVADPSR